MTALHEVVHQRWWRTGDRDDAARRGWQVHALVEVHACGEVEVRRALELFRASHRLQARDALHAATALVHGVPAIISPDADFDDVAGLERLAPADAAAGL